MPLAGKGMLITLMDADPAEERDFNQWYDKEHLIERVSIPGFLEARRYVADATESRNAVTAELDAVLDQVSSAHLLESDPELSRPADASAPDIGSGDWYVVVEATDEPALRQLAERRFGRKAKLPRAETIA